MLWKGVYHDFSTKKASAPLTHTKGLCPLDPHGGRCPLDPRGSFTPPNDLPWRHPCISFMGGGGCETRLTPAGCTPRQRKIHSQSTQDTFCILVSPTCRPYVVVAYGVFRKLLIINYDDYVKNFDFVILHSPCFKCPCTTPRKSIFLVFSSQQNWRTNPEQFNFLPSFISQMLPNITKQTNNYSLKIKFILLLTNNWKTKNVFIYIFILIRHVAICIARLFLNYWILVM